MHKNLIFGIMTEFTITCDIIVVLMHKN